MVIRFYNTLTRKKEVFKPRKDKRVNLFVCGPTVYDWSHIGHARTYLVYDMLVRYLRKLGYRVFFLENITDIDDRIIRRAREEGVTFASLSKRFTKAFLRDMRLLGITSVTRYAPARAYISEIIRQITHHLNRGYAYVARDGSVYFRVRKFKDYGKLSHQKLNRLRQFEPGANKEDPLDFALWKAAKPGEPKWKSPWGWGRPGWHIEDTAISEKFFGSQYDIHGGGTDLIFPHHECEIAQQEAASGKKPFVKYWLHTGMLKVRGEKMAKSLKNYITIRDLLSKTPAESFRLFIAQHHYRTPLEFSEKLLRQAEAGRERLREFMARLKAVKARAGVDDKGTISTLAKARKAFYDALADDFNTPKALAEVFTLVSKVNPLLPKGAIAGKGKRTLSEFFSDVDALFGIIGKVRNVTVPEKVKALAKKREEFRKEKRWEEADALRREIKARGWVIEDTSLGPRLKKRS